MPGSAGTGGRPPDRASDLHRPHDAGYPTYGGERETALLYIHVFLEGWVPAEQLSDVEHLLSQYSAAWEATDPEPDEYPQVPVKLKNNRLTRPLNMVTDMYVYPAYDGVDPNPLMAPFSSSFWNDDGRYGLRASHARRWHFYAQEAAAERNDGAYGRAFDPVRDQYVCDGSAYRKLLG